ncbi:unnamed protein product [Boreogadus saida]
MTPPDNTRPVGASASEPHGPSDTRYLSNVTKQAPPYEEIEPLRRHWTSVIQSYTSCQSYFWDDEHLSEWPRGALVKHQYQ